jgi:hypothetical protein
MKAARPTYSFFLNGWNPKTDELVKRALEDVKGSGLSPGTLEAAQVRLFNGKADTLKARLGFAKIDGQNILSTYRLLEFSYFDQKGTITRYEYKPFPPVHFKNEEKPRKYLQAKGRAPTPYVLPGVWAVKDKANRPLWITEGVKKVLKLTQHGRAAIGLSGVWNFKAGKDRETTDSKALWKDLEAFKWVGARSASALTPTSGQTPASAWRSMNYLSPSLHAGPSCVSPCGKAQRGLMIFFCSTRTPRRLYPGSRTTRKTWRPFCVRITAAKL